MMTVAVNVENHLEAIVSGVPNGSHKKNIN
jgi:hypothetical protein